MKMKFNSVLAVAMAAVIGMTACVKENGADVNGEATSVSLKIVDGASTRAVATPASDNVDVTFTDGYIFFTNSSDIIVKTTEIVAGSYPASPGQADQDAKAAGTKVWRNELTVANGAEIKNVPGAATKVWMAGNLPSGVTVPGVSANISVVKALVVDFASQSNVTGTVENVTLYGDGVALTDHATLPNTREAEVTLNAVGSRIEINKISYSNTPAFVTKFIIDGIFVNNYYPTMALNGDATGVTVVNNVPANNSAADLMYVPTAPAAGVAYPNSSAGVLFDYKAGAAGLGYSTNNVSWTAENGSKVWAYNVLAPTEPSASLTFPHIVIRLSGLETTADGANKYYQDKTQYLTVNSFKKTTGGAVLTSLEPGVVYYISDIVFNESHLTTTPEEATYTVFVEAKLMKWSREEIEWNN